MEDAWKKALSELKRELPARFFEPFIRPLKVLQHTESEPEAPESFVFGVEDEKILPHLESRYREPIQSKLKSLMGHDVVVEFRLDLTPSGQIASPLQPAVKSPAAWLNPHHTPDRFIRCRGNELALMACENAAKNPGATNPLFLYGDSGLGKTHLLHLSAHLLNRLHPELNVVYFTMDSFRDEFLSAMAARRMLEFKTSYRKYDVLLIDDLQSLKSSAPSLEEEFFYLYNHFFEQGKQIIMSADRAVSELYVSSRLMSRFLSGMQIRIDTMDPGSVRKLFDQRSQESSLNISPAVAEALCSRISGNVREIESVLNKLYFLQSRGFNTNSWEDIRNYFEDQLLPADNSNIPLEKILDSVCKKFDVKKDDILGHSRRAEYTQPRHTAMYLAVQYSGYNKSAIARFFKKTDHTTVINAEKNIHKRLQKDPSFQILLHSIVEDLRKRRG